MPAKPQVLNNQVVAWLNEAARLLAEQGANQFRVVALRQAADQIAGLTVELRDLLDREGPAALLRMPGIGPRLAAAVVDMVRTGRWSKLESLRGESDPATVWTRIPGIGPATATRLHDALRVETLGELLEAVHAGRLRNVPGMGPRRAATVAATIEKFAALSGLVQPPAIEPVVSLLLSVDDEYRRKAEAGTLRTVQPRRRGPSTADRIPILHTERGDWRFTALYSNTPRAHQFSRTRDWVVIYFHKDAEPDSRRTVVTEFEGPLAGRRVVRGREVECQLHYSHEGRD